MPPFLDMLGVLLNPPFLDLLFDSFPHAMISAFVIVAIEDWNDYYVVTSSAVGRWCAAYYVVLVIVGNVPPQGLQPLVYHSRPFSTLPVASLLIYRGSSTRGGSISSSTSSWP